MIEFNPFLALIDGVLISISTALLMPFNANIAGISGMIIGAGVY